MTTRRRGGALPAFVIVSLCVYIVLAAVAVILAYYWTVGAGGTLDEFTKVAGIWVTLLTSLLTAVVSIFVVFRQSSAAAGLEELKADLAARLEFLKGRFSAERKAYEELFSAACIYYHTLARLESGAWDRVQARKAEDAMLAACRYTISVGKEDRELWLQIWQRARAVSETAREKKNKADREQLWKNGAKEFGRLLIEFREVALAKHSSLEAREKAGVDKLPAKIN